MTAWTHENGCWSRPVGDGTIDAEIYDDELDDFPPLAALRAENAGLRERSDQRELLLAWLALPERTEDERQQVYSALRVSAARSSEATAP